jgi:hypothetical protein
MLSQTPTAPLNPANPKPPAQRPRYLLEAELDYARHELSVQQTVVYTNTTGQALVSIPLVVEARRYQGVFQLAGIYDAAGKKMLYLRQANLLSLNLTEVLRPGERLQFSLAYTLKLLDVEELPALRSYPLGYTQKQANFGDWYPFIPPFSESEGWLAHDLAYYGESLVYGIADFEVAIRLIGAQTGLVIAAPAAEVVDGDLRRYDHPAARNFTWSVSPYYQLISTLVNLGDGSQVEVASYYLPAYQNAGESVMETTVEALGLYTELYGMTYRHPKISAVQAGFMDGMEYDGLYFLGTEYYNWHRETHEDFLVALSAHETAHQWFYGLVGNDQAMAPWLDEAFCTYNEALFYEHIYPDALEWWWDWRVDYYQPDGYIDITIFDAPAVPGVYKEAYRDPVYLRGARFLDDLRKLVGDQAFFEILRAYVTRYAYRQADTEGFFTIVRRNTDQDLAPLLVEYFSIAP